MISIAIDGPAGAGKSTISKEVAKKLGFIYVDTGALYRAIGLYTVNRKVDTKDTKNVVGLLPEITISLEYKDQVQRVLLCEKDVSEEIRTPEISMAASNVSAIAEVREFLFNLQRDIAKNNNVIMDGRDIGTVVLPNAQIKIFLTASVEERAKRRYEEMIQKGVSVSYDEILQDIKTRDNNDQSRKVAPLKPAQDAIIVDTTHINLQESIDKLINIIKERLS